MKVRNIIITFWFEKYNNIKQTFDLFNKELTGFFPVFFMNSLPGNIDPIIPRISSQSEQRHSILNMSNINLQLVVNYDDNYNENVDLCFDYIQKRAYKIFDVLCTSGIKVLYSAILVNVDLDCDENPVEYVCNRLLKVEKNNKAVDEVGTRIATVIDDSIYQIISINNSKDYTITKEIKKDNTEIIMPLVSLVDASVDKEYLSISYELNDKYSFNNVLNYSCNKDIFTSMLKKSQEDIKEYILGFIETGVL